MTPFRIKAHLIDLDAKSASNELISPPNNAKRLPEFFSLGARSAKSIDASAQGYADGVAQTRIEYELLLARQIVDFQNRLIQERKRWAADEGERLAEKLHNGLRSVHASVGDTAARVIAPFMTETLENRAAAEFVASLEAALMNGGTDIQIKGPPDLLRAMQDKFQDDKARVTFTPADTCDLEVKMDDSIIETCIGRWIEKIREAVA
ncbi:MAG: hypothetical protein SGJ17_05695 [Hyphomicrobiales bacterium]|nr:hypothetical protein [Hyphomicrobiales bacterium]